MIENGGGSRAMGKTKAHKELNSKKDREKVR